MHAIAYLCFRDFMVAYTGEMKAEDMRHLFSPEKLIRTEITLLLGLLIKGEVDFSVPAPEVLQSYVDSTEALLRELHVRLTMPFHEGMAEWSPDRGPGASGAEMREPIFYGGESAYHFQYRELAKIKYAADSEWLRENKGFTIDDACAVVEAVGLTLDEQSERHRQLMSSLSADRRTHLPGNTLTAHDIAKKAKFDERLVTQVLDAFTVPTNQRNEAFTALSEFNAIEATPLLRAPSGAYVVFNIYSLAQAIYEAPFFWMIADTQYLVDAMRHRGRFLEQYSVDRLGSVFGSANVYANVEIFDGKNRVGEIDVLVIFGNRAIVLQAKSKRLTIEARKGNDGQLKDDFKKSIQDSWDQGYSCAQKLIVGTLKFVAVDGREIVFPYRLSQIFILCIVSDHYPALSFQARAFLEYKTTDVIQPPFVLDVFTLDVLAEMLDSPLELLSYIERRAKYSDQLVASHELNILGYHLKKNLWLQGGKENLLAIGDDVSAELDLAMAVRRDGVHGRGTPDGILTRLPATELGRLIRKIEARPDPATLDLGFMLLTMGEETVDAISQGLLMIRRQARHDKQNHDVTVALGAGDTGLTVHCNYDPIEVVAGPKLEAHCALRKYSRKAHSWFGICISPDDGSPRFGINLQSKWEFDPVLEAGQKHLSKSADDSALIKGRKGRKVGRNDPCPCGSGKKYKKCCGRD